MKTIPLRRLMREPLKVKRWTRTGQPVQITDNGKPLWIIQPASEEGDPEERRHAIDELLDEVLSERPREVSAAKLLEASRR